MTRFTLSLVASSLFVAAASAQAPAKKVPNILFIMSDDHASAAVSCYGPSFLGKYAKTPNIDRIAKGGVRFKNSLVTNSICTPGRDSHRAVQQQKRRLHAPPSESGASDQ